MFQMESTNLFMVIRETGFHNISSHLEYSIDIHCRIHGNTYFLAFSIFPSSFYSLFSLHVLLSLFTANPLIQLIHPNLLPLHSIDEVTFFWIPGHIDLLEHNAVDQVANQATNFPKVTSDMRLPVLVYKNHYRSFILQS